MSEEIHASPNDSNDLDYDADLPEEFRKLAENWAETMRWGRIERRLYKQVREEIERERGNAGSTGS